MSSTFKASSPGRLDVMGGYADYSGSLVLQMPIANETSVTITLRDDYVCTVRSEITSEETLHTTLRLRELLSSDFSIKQSHNFFSDPQIKWTTYVVGCALLLHQLKKIDFKGADFIVKSTVPLGKGVSSSAALEVATMKALALAFQLKFTGTELPILAQKVENQIVGAPCGLMDQLASYHGVAHHLLPITCQPDILHSPITIPHDLKFIGIDSGVKHSVSGASYTDVRCAAFMGYSIIAQSMGVSPQEIKHAHDSDDWKNIPFNGYLCNITPQEFDLKFKSLLPKTISGKDFISKYQTTTDSVTQVDPEKNYAVLNCTWHPVLENARVKSFQDILEAINKTGISVSAVSLLGACMYQSHAGYTLCGLNSARTDALVELAQQHEGIYGAKITGGGSGGTVCLLTYGEAGIQSANKIHRIMEERYQHKLVLFV